MAPESVIFFLSLQLRLPEFSSPNSGSSVIYEGIIMI